MRCRWKAAARRPSIHTASALRHWRRFRKGRSEPGAAARGNWRDGADVADTAGGGEGESQPGATPEPWAVAAQEASASGAWSVQEYTEAETNSISSRRTSMIFTNTLHVRKLPQMRELCRLSEASHDLDQLAIGVSRCIYRPPCPA